jgi:hypothetical protein
MKANGTVSEILNRENPRIVQNCAFRSNAFEPSALPTECIDCPFYQNPIPLEGKAQV